MDIPASGLADAEGSLALAVIGASSAPVLLLDGCLAVVAASASFCGTFGIDPARVAGRPLAGLGDGEWNVPQFGSLLRATASGLAEIDAYEMDLARKDEPVRLLVINARKLDHADAESVRLLVAVSDVTEARSDGKLRDDLLREKELLLQELQHRVANSLQIIASVLMQNARRMSSEQARGHLLDASNRVLSIATMQRQLAVSRLGDVALRGYFNELCDSIGTSMIRSHDQISLDVDVDDTMVKADVSVSLGLIVTELVINALKHAFPRDRKGKIHVGYQADGAAWTLSVRDTGIGMPPDHASAKPGLGTGIVEALARHLDASVQVNDGEPGTAVSIVRL